MRNSIRTTAAPGSRAAAIEKQRAHDRLQKLRAPLLPTPPHYIKRLRALVNVTPGTDGDSQTERLLCALICDGVTSHDARQHLDIVHPAGRVHTLRKRGYLIDTTWVRQVTACGKVHRFGRYVLMRHA